MNKEILRLAIPSILANITVPIVGIVDVAIAGHIANASAIGGIAIGKVFYLQYVTQKRHPLSLFIVDTVPEPLVRGFVPFALTYRN